MKLIGMIKDMTTDVPVNFGKGLDEVQERQRRRKMMTLREGCKRALWFADSFQIDLLKLVFCSKETGKPIEIEYKCADTSVPIPSDDDKLVQLHRILYILDRFSVSDEFYHELSMMQPSLPHSYTIKAARTNMNSNIKLE